MLDNKCIVDPEVDKKIQELVDKAKIVDFATQGVELWRHIFRLERYMCNGDLDGAKNYIKNNNL